MFFVLLLFTGIQTDFILKKIQNFTHLYPENKKLIKDEKITSFFNCNGNRYLVQL